MRSGEGYSTTVWPRAEVCNPFSQSGSVSYRYAGTMLDFWELQMEPRPLRRPGRANGAHVGNHEPAPAADLMGVPGQHHGAQVDRFPDFVDSAALVGDERVAEEDVYKRQNRYPR